MVNFDFWRGFFSERNMFNFFWQIVGKKLILLRKLSRDPVKNLA